MNFSLLLQISFYETMRCKFDVFFRIMTEIHNNQDPHRYSSMRHRCYDCQFPPCVQCQQEGKGENRPLHAIPHNSIVEATESAVRADFVLWKPPCGPGYYCDDHRYPACKCGNRRDNPGSKHRFKPYTCATCASDPGKPRLCVSCKQCKPLKEFEMEHRNISSRCEECRFPTCQFCKTKLTTMWTPNPRAPDQRPSCATCSTRKCIKCGMELQAQQSMVSEFCSDECQYPPCENANCSEPRPKDPRNIWSPTKPWYCPACDPDPGKRRLCVSCERCKPLKDFEMNNWKKSYEE